MLDHRPASSAPSPIARSAARRRAVARRAVVRRRRSTPSSAERLGAHDLAQAALLADVRARRRAAAGSARTRPSAGPAIRNAVRRPYASARTPTSVGAIAAHTLCRTMSSDVPRPRSRGCSTSARAALSGACGATRHIAASVKETSIIGVLLSVNVSDEQREARAAGRPPPTSDPPGAQAAVRQVVGHPARTGARRRARRGRAG